LDGESTPHTTTSPYTANESQKVKFCAVDNLGNTSGWTELCDIKIDTAAPTGLTITPDPDKKGWTSDNVVLKASVDDGAGSGVASCQWSTNQSNWTEILLSDGYTVKDNNTIYCRCFDVAGNVSEIVKRTVDNIDRTPPVISKAPTVSFVRPDTDKPITQAKIEWDNTNNDKAYDTESSKIKVKLFYKINNFEYNQDPVDGEKLNISHSISLTPAEGVSRTVDNTVKAWVVVTDEAGNSSKSIEPLLILPAYISADSDPTDTLNGDHSVSVTTNITNYQAKNHYKKVIIQRDNGGNEQLPTKYTNVDKEVPIGALAADNNKFVINDTLSTKDGVGHRFIKYRIYTEISDGKSGTIRELNSTTRPVLLKNTPGTLKWNIKVGDQFKYLDFGVETDRPENPDFVMDSHGLVSIYFMITDDDNETWDLELDKTILVDKGEAGATSYVRQGYSTISSVNSTGCGSSYSVCLSYNINHKATNTMVFYWMERTNDDSDKNASAIFTLELLPPVYGNEKWSLNVTDEYATYDYTGITVRPGENLKIIAESAKAGPSEFAWDFGDGYKDTVASVSHAYKQKEDRTSDTSTYDLSLTVTKISDGSFTNIPLKIYVIDTRIGRLLVNEEWRGDHTLIGEVIIPSGKTLILNSDYPGVIITPNTLTISSAGGIGAGYQQGITVQSGGTLSTQGTHNIVFDTVSGQKQTWGSIYVDGGGNATLGNCLIKNAERGIVAVSSATTTINTCVFTSNVIGLHLFGGSIVTITDSTINDNKVYGVKEEQGATPVLKSNKIFSNLRDYYSYNKGLLTVSEVNSNNIENTGNTGNTGAN
jgi:hypothetical protein